MKDLFFAVSFCRTSNKEGNRWDYYRHVYCYRRVCIMSSRRQFWKMFFHFFSVFWKY